MSTSRQSFSTEIELNYFHSSDAQTLEQKIKEVWEMACLRDELLNLIADMQKEVKTSSHLKIITKVIALLSLAISALALTLTSIYLFNTHHETLWLAGAVTGGVVCMASLAYAFKMTCAYQYQPKTLYSLRQSTGFTFFQSIEQLKEKYRNTSGMLDDFDAWGNQLELLSDPMPFAEAIKELEEINTKLLSSLSIKGVEVVELYDAHGIENTSNSLNSPKLSYTSGV